MGTREALYGEVECLEEVVTSRCGPEKIFNPNTEVVGRQAVGKVEEYCLLG
jgi:hypothetical protein